MAFQEVNPNTWTYKDEGDSITGILIKKEEDVGPNNSMMYHLESDGKPISVWGSTILDQRMQFIEVGSKVRITYKGTGEKKGGKNAPKVFKVELDDGLGQDPVVAE